MYLVGHGEGPLRNVCVGGSGETQRDATTTSPGRVCDAVPYRSLGRLVF